MWSELLSRETVCSHRGCNNWPNEEYGTRGGQVTPKNRSHIKHRCWCKNVKTPSAPWVSNWVDGIDRFPQEKLWGISYGYRDEDIISPCCIFTGKPATRHLGETNHCKSKPIQHHLAAFYIIHKTTQQTPYRSLQLPVTVLCAAIRLNSDWLRDTASE